MLSLRTSIQIGGVVAASLFASYPMLGIAQTAINSPKVAVNTTKTTVASSQVQLATITPQAEVVKAFIGRIRSIRMLKNLSQEAMASVVVTVDDDDAMAVDQVSLSLSPRGVGPTPLINPVILKRTSTSYDARGTLFVSKASGVPLAGVRYSMVITLTDANGAVSDPITLLVDTGEKLTGPPVIFYRTNNSGETLTGPPIIFSGTAYSLVSLGWSEAADCTGCPILKLGHAATTTAPVSPAPIQVKIAATSVTPGVSNRWNASFSAFSTTAEFSQAAVPFARDPLGAAYTTKSVMMSRGAPIGKVSTAVVVVAREVAAPVPVVVPTLVIDGVVSGSISINKGDYVVLSGTVKKSVTVNGGVLLIKGGVVGHNLKLNGGEVILDGAEIKRNLKARGGKITVMQANIRRNLRIRGAVEILGDAASLLRIGQDVTGKTTESVRLGSNLTVGGKVAFTSMGGGLIVDGNLRAKGAIALRVNNKAGLVVNGDMNGGGGILFRNRWPGGGMVVNGSIHANDDIDMRTSGGGVTVGGTISGANVYARIRYKGDLVVNGSIHAETGEIEMRIGGGIKIGGTVTAKDHIEMRIRHGDLVVNGSIHANDDIDMRIRHGDLVVNGSIHANDDIDMRTAGGTTVGPKGGITAVSIHVIGQSPTGDTTIQGTLRAQKSLVLNSKGSVTLDSGSLSATQGNVTVKARGLVGLYTFDDAPASLSAGGDIEIEVSEALSLSGRFVFGGDGFVWSVTKAQTITIEGPGSLFFDGVTGEVSSTLDSPKSMLTDPAKLLSAATKG